MGLVLLIVTNYVFILVYSTVLIIVEAVINIDCTSGQLPNNRWLHVIYCSSTSCLFN
ncbi:hypothetical protein ASPFODRAFT_464267 [Aspergillus luchuensis CBS 106.47]|uniref:Uncharacterized protein n=1 Tax=Aspergillus luchuensis (strain CBS 106.47) TaxID=1137211 RepID=A0A1M3T0C9_ASPLC|nr:hypothetical protein ASPFODRAFT_464267 [Aspergillus luchuensis CBS 106.47]